jgi:hypothetical protein
VSHCSLVQRSPNDCGLSNECDLEAPAGEAMTRNRVEAQQQKSCNTDSQGDKFRLPLGISILSTVTVT